MKAMRALLFVVAVAMILTAPALMAQTGSTGALTGTITDPSGAVISGATVTATNIATGAERTDTTTSDGVFKFSLLSPGNYRVRISASGFKTAEAASVTVNVADTAVLNHSLEIGAQSVQVTVEATTVQIQTENATTGGTVSGDLITSLPLVSRNYTQIISLSPGVGGNASTASAVGNGTQDVSVNGARFNNNNYSMDGSSIVNYLSGTGAQTGSFPGMAIANPDAIQEFTIQTSQFGAASGRDTGANVNVVTKTGSNSFHGAAWEYNRNNFFNANDFFYHYSEVQRGLANKPQTLKQNTFGFDLQGPIKKDKILFFGSYQGIRQINGMGTSGFASGYASNTLLLPWDDPASAGDPRHVSNPAAYRAYLGSVFGGNTGFFTFLGGTGTTIAANGANISNTALGYLQSPGTVKGGYNHGFYMPGAPSQCFTRNLWVIPGNPASGCVVAISDPIRANEDQFIINTHYILSKTHSLDERFIYSNDPQFQPFNCFIFAGNCNPGAPINAHYQNYYGQLSLTSVFSSNLVNQARFSFHRDIENNTDPAIAKSCGSANFNVIPLVNNGAACGSALPSPNSQIASKFPETNILPMLDVFASSGPTGSWSQGGNFAMISSNFNNTYQYADSLSWTHGRQTWRWGFEFEHLQHNGTIPASERGELFVWSTPDFLTSSAGVGPDGTPATPGGGLFVGFGLKGWLTHYNHVNSWNWYAQDDIKVNAKLTVNLGLRYEWNGFPNDTSGRFSNSWDTEAAKINTGSWFLSHPTGTLTGLIVPSNYDPTYGLTAPNGASGVLVNTNQTLMPGEPWHNFAPRIGAAWQPLGNKFVVRAGWGMFYDRLYGVLLIDNQLNLPPYSGAGFGSSPASNRNTLHNPWLAGTSAATGLPWLSWTPRQVVACTGFAAPIAPCTAPGTIYSSALGYTSDAPQLANQSPITYTYNLDLQYQIAKGWLADIGYVGRHGTHLYNWSQQLNVAHLVAGAPHNPTLGAPNSPNFNAQNVEMIATSLPFNDPSNATPLTSNTIGGTGNVNERVGYLGFSPAGLASTKTIGDMLYNSLQAQLQHQFGHGLFLQVSYTWSKELTDIDESAAGGGIEPPSAVLYGASNSNNPLDYRQQYGLATFNRPQRVIIAYQYQLPYKNMEGVSGKVLGGWSVSGTTLIQSGLPFTVTDSGGNTIYGAGGSRAALANPGACDSHGNCKSLIAMATSGDNKCRLGLTNPTGPAGQPLSGCPTLQGWINNSAFLRLAGVDGNSPYCIGGTFFPGGSGAAPCGAGFFPGPASIWQGAGIGYGNSPKSVVMSNGQLNFDFGVQKDTKLWEHGTLQFYAQAFNLFNHAQFAPPTNINAGTAGGVTPTTPGGTFGRISQTWVTPRVIQFGLKYSF